MKNVHGPTLDRDAVFGTRSGSLQTASIVPLAVLRSRRMFQRRPAVRHVATTGIFIRAALAARKKLEYAADKFEPRAGDLHPYRTRSTNTRRYMSRQLTDRHKVFVTPAIHRRRMYELFQNVPRVDLSGCRCSLSAWNALFSALPQWTAHRIRRASSDFRLVITLFDMSRSSTATRSRNAQFSSS